MQRSVWYVPHRQLRTVAARREASRIAGCVAAGVEPLSAQSLHEQETQLFIALHTCAYRAISIAKQRGSNSARSKVWVARWQLIRSHLLERNLGLAHAMSGRFSVRQAEHLVDDDDLLSEALCALSRAVDRFNPWKGYRFSTYACNVIMRALVRASRRENRYHRLFPFQHDAALERPGPPSDVDTELYVERLERVLDHNLGSLSDLERSIITQRFPQNLPTSRTYRDIGRSIGLSKERIRQIQNVALAKLREALERDLVLK
ncbi:MAG: sigma-70 family RNA polymerase sigma factor [Phycisphaerae bacterium]|nr:sigma-70 family RNA polymerase sigma factor [Phycisphaerae bacterium]